MERDLLRALRNALDIALDERGELVLAGGDMCGSRHCGDIALPGQELCAGCIADLQAERAQRDEQTARLTAQHEARVEAQEAAA